MTTPVGAAPELLESNATALLVPPRDAQAVARAIGSLLDDTGLRERLGRGAQAKAREFEIGRVHAATIAAPSRQAGASS